MLRKKDLKALWRIERRTLFSVTIGTLLACFSVVALTMPYRFAGGGIIGIALIAEYAWGISPAWVVGIGNALLLVWGWKALSPRFAMWTIYVTVLSSVSIPLMEMFEYPLLENTILAAVLAGMVAGLGFGMLFRADASSGGMDIIAMVLRKRRGVDIGAASFYLNAAVLTLSIVVVDVESILMGALLLYVESLMVDRVVRSFNRRTQVTVISDKPHEIAQFIVNELDRTATVLPAVGAYSGKEGKMLVVVLTRRQSVSLKAFVHQVDPGAFLIFADVAEVVGKGFKGWDKTA
ncbi:MAG TPA: YitT family protein [Candidatus Mailhella merdavium]|nr:YitT family protein [Candidatus Mailhella merdavium]